MFTFAMTFSSSPHICGDPPTLVDPNVYFPGLARTNASNSCRLFAGTLGCTDNTFGVVAIREIGAKSVAKLNGWVL